MGFCAMYMRDGCVDDVPRRGELDAVCAIERKEVSPAMCVGGNEIIPGGSIIVRRQTQLFAMMEWHVGTLSRYYVVYRVCIAKRSVTRGLPYKLHK